MVKVDIRKAYDTVDWRFLQNMLVFLRFPPKFVGWIMECVSSAKYSILLNGVMHGYFEGKRGLRQGDPLSPYLFVMCMKYFSRSMKDLRGNKDFKFHPKCAPLSISHLIFADDLLMFTKAEVNAMLALKNKVNEFSIASGLVVNQSNSSIFLARVTDSTRTQIVQAMGYEQGNLPVKYLGVPLSSARVSHQHCAELLAKMEDKLQAWGSFKVSYAGRIELVKSALMSMHIYWTGVYLLPKKTIRMIDRMCCNFVWGCREDIHKFHLLSWDKMCLEKSKGGLGLFKAEVWNMISILKILWAIHKKEDQLWIKWLHGHYLKTENIWKVHHRSGDSWFWRKMLQVRDRVLSKWSTKVAVIEQIQKWEVNGKFCTSAAYREIYSCQSQQVPWHSIVWCNMSIPKHKIVLWLAIWGRFLTQDRLQHFGLICESVCILCLQAHENVDHLFFHCPFATMVWKKLLIWYGKDRDPLRLHDEVVWFCQFGRGRGVKKKILIALFAAAVYHIWRERNLRRFQQKSLSVDQIVKQIKLEVISMVCSLNISPQYKFWIEHL